MSVSPKEPEKKPSVLWNNLGALLVNLGVAGGVLAWVEMASKLPPDVALPVQIACAGMATMAVVQFGWNLARVSHAATQSDLERIGQDSELNRAKNATGLSEEENKRLRAEIEREKLNQELAQVKAETPNVATQNVPSGSVYSTTYVPPEIEDQPVQKVGQGGN